MMAGNEGQRGGGDEKLISLWANSCCGKLCGFATRQTGEGCREVEGLLVQCHNS